METNINKATEFESQSNSTSVEDIFESDLTPAQKWILQFSLTSKSRKSGYMDYGDGSYDDGDGYNGDTGCSWE